MDERARRGHPHRLDREGAFGRLLDWWYLSSRGYKLGVLKTGTLRLLPVLAALALLLAGVSCLYLSEHVARAGSWWQSTLDAFGVGLVIGALVDVLVVTTVAPVAVAARRRAELQQEGFRLSNAARYAKVASEMRQYAMSKESAELAAAFVPTEALEVLANVKAFLAAHGPALDHMTHQVLTNTVDYLEQFTGPQTGSDTVA